MKTKKKKGKPTKTERKTKKSKGTPRAAFETNGGDVIERIAKLADSLGVYAADLHRVHNLESAAKRFNLKIDQITGGSCYAADILNREAMQELVKRSGATYSTDGPRRPVKKEPLPPEYCEPQNVATAAVETDETVTKSKKDKGSPAPAKTKPPKGNLIFGFPATAVVRWMGKEGWEYPDAARAIKALGADIADDTIRIQLRAGAKGQRGEPAKISPQQEREIYLSAKQSKK